MHRLPLIAWLVLLWHALVATPLHAQVSPPCDPNWREHAQGEVKDGYYIVVQDDTLYSIAKRLCVKLEDLAYANILRDPSQIFIGQSLFIPSSGARSGTGSGTHCPSPALTITDPAAGSSVSGAAFYVRGSVCGLVGDTVSVVAWDQLNNMDVVNAQLYAANAGTAYFSALMELRSVRGPQVGLMVTGPGNTHSDPVIVNYYGTPATCVPSYITIGEARFAPASGVIDVAGEAGPNCRVTVTVSTPSGAFQPVTGYVDSGADSKWKVTMPLPGGYAGASAIVTASTSAGGANSVTVQLNGGTGAGYRDLYQLPGCWLRVSNSAAESYTNPGGPVVSKLGPSWPLTPQRSVLISGQPWYAIASPTPGKPDEWVRGVDVQLMDCPQ